MTYSECAQYIDGILNLIDWEDTEDCSLQFNMIGADSGVFYIDIRDHAAGVRYTEDGEYNVKYVFTAPVFSRLLRKVVDPIYAYTTGKFKIMGDVPLGRRILIKLCEQYNKTEHE